MSTLIDLYLGTFIHKTMGRLIGSICTVWHLVTDQRLIDTLTVGAGELTHWTGGILLLTVHFIRVIATIIFTVTAILVANTFEILTRELHGRTGLILGIAELALIRTIATVIVMIAYPTLLKINQQQQQHQCKLSIILLS